MDEKYPTLKRPKKQLVYPTTTPRLDQWAQNINTLEDVDKMFDDLDSNDADFPSPSPEIHLTNKSKHVKRDITPFPAPEELIKCQMVANGDHKHPSYSPASPEHDINSETPFKAHKPVSTSSPIEENVIQHGNKENDKEDNSASPILFDCAEEKQDLETAETSADKHQHKNTKRDESDNSDFETLPKKSAMDKFSAEKTKTVPKRSKPSSPPVSPVRRKVLKTPSAPEKLTERVQVSTKVKHDMTSFLQKLKDAGQPKPTFARMSQAKVMPPLPEPEPDDEFLIMEEDVAFFVSIPNKHSRSAKEGRTKASCSDTEAKGAVGEEHSENRLQDIEQHHSQQSQAEKTDKKTNDNGSGSNEDRLSLPMTESENVDNKVLQTKNRKKGVKKVPSKVGKNTEENDAETDVEIPSKKNGKQNKAAKKVSKSLKSDKETAQRKKTFVKKTDKGATKADALTDEVDKQSQEVHIENPLVDEAPVSEVNNVETEPTKDIADGNLEWNKPSSQEMSDEDIVVGKRKRRPPGDWWISSPHVAEQEASHKQPTVKKTKRASKESSSAASSEKTATGGGKKHVKRSSSSSDGQKQNTEKEKVKKVKVKQKRPVKSTLSDKPGEDLGHAIQDRALDQDSDSDSSPLLFPHRERSISSEGRVFDKVYQKGQSEKPAPSLPERASTTSHAGLPGSRRSSKRRLRPPGNWWEVSPTPQEQQEASQSPQQNPKDKTSEKNEKRVKKPRMRSQSKPLEGAPTQTKRLSTTKEDYRRTNKESQPLKKVATSKKQLRVSPAPAEVIEANHNVITMQNDELPGVGDREQDTFQDSISRVIVSGPSSMIGLENYEEDEDLVLPSTTVQPDVCASDLCSAPLRPLTLLPKDKVNLQAWLKFLWPAADKNLESTPDDFEWYCYRGRAMGITTDLQTSTICNGKMLLGSYMQKPLWVDHSATTMFNLFTSSVRVVMDCNKSQYSAGQCFMVPPGHAYSIKNLSGQPAMLYFTRFFTEENDD